jgi:hypothetical protein
VRSLASIALVLLAALVIGCDRAAVPTKGTMPPGDVDWRNAASVAPDFIAVWDRDGVRIAGYVPRSYLFPAPTVVPIGAEDPPMPVYAADLRTLVGHMVAGKGFVPVGVDPASIADIPVEAGPAGPVDAPSGGPLPGTLALYVRTESSRTAWFGQRRGAGFVTATGFDADGAGCFELEVGDEIGLYDRSPDDPAAGRMRIIETVDGGEPAGMATWVVITRGGVVTQGAGKPEWWPWEPPC